MTDMSPVFEAVKRINDRLIACTPEEQLDHALPFLLTFSTDGNACKVSMLDNVTFWWSDQDAVYDDDDDVPPEEVGMSLTQRVETRILQQMGVFMQNYTAAFHTITQVFTFTPPA